MAIEWYLPSSGIKMPWGDKEKERLSYRIKLSCGFDIPFHGQDFRGNQHRMSHVLI